MINMLIYQTLAFTLSNLSIYYTRENIKKSYKNNKSKISSPTWNKEFELPDGWYSVSHIQDIMNISSKTWHSYW